MKKLIFIICCLFSISAMSAVNNAVSYTKKDIQNIITLKAKKHGVSVSLAMAIAKVESDFNHKALSHAGAKGVMQIMPATAMGEFGVSKYRLYDPTTNIDLGVRFIKHLITTYDGRIDIALSHYNGGSRVRTNNGDLRIIPATRQYVNKVLTLEKEYRYLNQSERVSFVNVTTSNKSKINKLDDFSSSAIQKLKAKYTDVKPAIHANSIDVSSNANGSTIDSRVATLQALRVHNLTRTLTANTHNSSSRAQQYLPNNNKSAKVKAWESIFD